MVAHGLLARIEEPAPSTPRNAIEKGGVIAPSQLCRTAAVARLVTRPKPALFGADADFLITKLVMTSVIDLQKSSVSSTHARTIPSSKKKCATLLAYPAPALAP